ncbi:MAG: PD40 domain-containing protein, partial [Acidobacteria bacterium]|nr:PD40 domain-containing protein [Acidobacteriota bacterium]
VLLPELPAGDAVRGVELLVPGGGRVDWSVQGDFLAYDRAGSDGLYDIYKSSADGAGRVCLTCPLLEFQNANATNPSWHPSGRLLVFQVQQRARQIEQTLLERSTPERGLHTELWTITADGRSFFQLTRPEQSGPSLLDPCFSHEGKLLAWSERATDRGGLWGEWILRVGRFDERAGVPRLSHVRTYRPGGGRSFVEIDGFTADDRGLILSGNLEPGQPESGMDLYRFDLETEQLTRLTRTLGDFDDAGHVSPAGDRLAWASGRDVPPLLRGPGRDAGRPFPTDLWLMNLDGSGAQRLTIFNPDAGRDPSFAAAVTDLAWNPDGDRIAATVVRDFGAPREDIFLVELDPNFGRRPH